jgi:hypothetical protein
MEEIAPYQTEENCYPTTPRLSHASISESPTSPSGFSSLSSFAGRHDYFSPITPDDTTCLSSLHDIFLDPPTFQLNSGHREFQIPKQHSGKNINPSRSYLPRESSPPCLQCVVKGLPCDRAWPHCSRCSRSGDAAVCLLQRPRCSSQDESIEGPLVYALLHTSEDDTEWAAKVVIEEQVSSV